MNETNSSRDSSLAEIIRQIPGYDSRRDSAGCYFDEQAAENVVNFIEQCVVHVKGRKGGSPFLLEAWQKAIVANLFGWKLTDTGFRRYRESLIYVPRKQGKSSLAAAIILYMLLVDREIGAEVYCAAAAGKQARVVFDIVTQMIRRSQILSRRTNSYMNGIITIDPETKRPTGSVFKALNSEASTEYGLNPSCIIIDELHAHPSGALADALETSIGARNQPLVIHLTTADYNRESLCNRKYLRACQIRDGLVRDPTFLPVIYEADETDDWTCESTWRKANPNFGVTVDKAFFKKEIETAINFPSEQARVRRMYLNQQTDTSKTWLTTEAWNRCNIDVDEEHLAGRRCFGGLDLSSTSDLTAFVLVFPGSAGIDVLCRFWVPLSKTLTQYHRDKVSYTDWVRDGWISYAGENSIDQDVIVSDIQKLSEKYDLQKIGFDRWNKGNVDNRLSGTGLTIFPFGQGFQSLSAPSKLLERLIFSGRLHHGGHPVLKWNAMNTMLKSDEAGNIKPDKSKSTGKIDGIVALVMALGVMDAEPEPVNVDNMLFGI